MTRLHKKKVCYTKPKPKDRTGGTRKKPVSSNFTSSNINRRTQEQSSVLLHNEALSKSKMFDNNPNLWSVKRPDKAFTSCKTTFLSKNYKPNYSSKPRVTYLKKCNNPKKRKEAMTKMSNSYLTTSKVNNYSQHSLPSKSLRYKLSKRKKPRYKQEVSKTSLDSRDNSTTACESNKNPSNTVEYFRVLSDDISEDQTPINESSEGSKMKFGDTIFEVTEKSCHMEEVQSESKGAFIMFDSTGQSATMHSRTSSYCLDKFEGVSIINQRRSREKKETKLFYSQVNNVISEDLGVKTDKLRNHSNIESDIQKYIHQMPIEKKSFSIRGEDDRGLYRSNKATNPDSKKITLFSNINVPPPKLDIINDSDFQNGNMNAFNSLEDNKNISVFSNIIPNESYETNNIHSSETLDQSKFDNLVKIHKKLCDKNLKFVIELLKSRKEQVKKPKSFSKNEIDINDKSDSRTKLMVKNIPNKYNIIQLVDLFNPKFKDKFDFVYLVIDNITFCNQGYGFVNMVPGLAKYEFFQEFNNASWPSSKSGKKCEISYAIHQTPQKIDSSFINKYFKDSHKYWVSPQLILNTFPHMTQDLEGIEKHRKNYLAFTNHYKNHVHSRSHVSHPSFDNYAANGINNMNSLSQPMMGNQMFAMLPQQYNMSYSFGYNTRQPTTLMSKYRIIAQNRSDWNKKDNLNGNH